MGYIGKRMTRVEDERLVTGQGRYVSDIELPGTVHMAIVRSLYAHAEITRLDLNQAQQLPGVVGVFGPKELAAIMKPLPLGTPDPRLDAITPMPLAGDRVHYVGEPVAVVVACDRYVAEDAAALVSVGYRALDALTDPRLAATAPPLHPGHPSNEVATVEYRVGQGEEAFRDADVVVDVDLRLDRVVAHPMEPRGVVAHYDAKTEELLIFAGTQGVHGYRRAIASMLDLNEDHVRVIAPDTGGGFGVKNRIYPEDVLAAYLSCQLSVPVKWQGDRSEEFISTNQERDQWHHARIGVKKNGQIVAVSDEFFQDQGAYTPAGIIVADTTAICIPGPYRVPNFAVTGHVVLTNKVPVGPYRGAGRPQGTFVMERLLDHVADTLGMDRLEIRRINLIKPEELPYQNGLPGRGGPMTIPYGEFQNTMDQVATAINYDHYSHPHDTRGPWKLGVGIANYLEMSGGAGFEGARMRLLDDGRVEVATGASSQGQGHLTAFAQVAADRLQLPFEQIVVVEGDTSAIHRGIGTFGSRSMMMVGNATRMAAQGFRTKLLEFAAEMFEASMDDLHWENGTITVKGVPSRTISLADIATRAAQEDRALVYEAFYDATGPAFGMGTHAVVVAVHQKTFAIEIREYQICHDGGVVVNPLLADGQTIGGTVQGLGTALFEGLVFDATGQPLNATFLDYLLPAAGEMPDFLISEREYPEPTNPEGFKGIAEGGIMPPMAAICAAVENALREFSITVDQLPVTPNYLFSQVKEGSR